MNALRPRPSCWWAPLSLLLVIACAPIGGARHDAGRLDGAAVDLDAAKPPVDASARLDAGPYTSREGGVSPADDAEVHSHDATTDAAPVLSDAAGVPLTDASGPCSTQVRSDAADTWVHVNVGSTVTYTNNPPSSGAHYPVWARWQTHTSAVPRPYWVHNLEHGGIVLLYGLGATSNQISDLKSVYESLPLDPKCTHARALLTEDPDLTVPIAAVAAGHVLLASCVDAARIIEFVNTYRDMAPESVCGDGSYP